MPLCVVMSDWCHLQCHKLLHILDFTNEISSAAIKKFQVSSPGVALVSGVGDLTHKSCELSHNLICVDAEEHLVGSNPRPSSTCVVSIMILAAHSHPVFPGAY